MNVEAVAWGALFVVLALASVLALIGSSLVLWRYRRAVTMAMGTGGGGGGESRTAPARPGAAVGDRAARERDDLFVRAVGAPRVEIACIALAGAAYAVVLASAYLITTPAARTPWRFALTLWIDAWPIVVAAALTTAYFARTVAIGIAIYALALAVGAVVALALPESPRDSGAAAMIALENTITPRFMALAWLVYAAVPTAVLLLFLNPRLRAVSPLLLAFAMVWIAMLIAAWAAIFAPPLRYVPLWLADKTSGGWAGWLFLAVEVVLGLAASIAAAWLVLRWIRRAYLRKAISDRTLAIDTLFVFFATYYAMQFAVVGVACLLTGVLAFAAYRVVVSVGRAQVRRRAVALAPRGLVFLRVFALGDRTSTLFAAVAKHWRRVGSMQLIAGPDLARSTAQPHQLLDFVAGRLASHFIVDAHGVDAQVAGVDRSADRDGWFRVHSFFCRADTWQTVLARMVEQGDVVLMDLRSFSPSNAGCEHELRHLVARVPLARCVFVVDATTDDAHFRTLLERSLAELDEASPNHGVRSDTVVVHSLGRGPAGWRALLRRLCDAA